MTLAEIELLAAHAERVAEAVALRVAAEERERIRAEVRAERSAEIEAFRLEIRSLADLHARAVPEPVAGGPGRDGLPGADGRGIDRLEERSGRLWVRYSDGHEQDVGELPRGPQGERGEPGVPGERGEPGPVGPAGERGVDGTPGERGERGEPGVAGAPGERGERGADGIAREEFDRAVAEAEARGEERGARLVLVRTFADVDRGVWQPGTFQRGDLVTYHGSTWLASVDTTAQPGTSADWRLLAQRGRDGRDKR